MCLATAVGVKQLRYVWALSSSFEGWGQDSLFGCHGRPTLGSILLVSQVMFTPKKGPTIGKVYTIWLGLVFVLQPRLS